MVHVQQNHEAAAAAARGLIVRKDAETIMCALRSLPPSLATHNIRVINLAGDANKVSHDLCRPPPPPITSKWRFIEISPSRFPLWRLIFPQEMDTGRKEASRNWERAGRRMSPKQGAFYERGLPDMMSASERVHGKADVVREVA